MLPPVFYPAYLLPSTLRYAVMVVPTAAAAELVRQVSGIGASVSAIVPLVSRGPKYAKTTFKEFERESEEMQNEILK